MTDATGSIVFQCLDFVARDEYILEQNGDTVKVGYDEHLQSDEEEYKPRKQFEKRQWHNPKMPSPDDEKKGFQILLFGSNHDGKSITIEITGFKPYFYVQIPETWTSLQKAMYEKYLRTFVHHSPEAQEHVLIKEERHKKLYDFDNGYKHRFLKITVPSLAIWRRMSNALMTEGLEMKPLPKSVSKNEEKLKVYESNIDPVLRFFHERNLEPAGWMRIPPHMFDEVESDDTTTVLRYSCPWNVIEPDTSRISLAPLLLASWDIECMSSHGDFPQPRKTWRKPARELLEAGITDADDAIVAIVNAMNCVPSSQISHIYIKQQRKKPWTISEFEKEIPEPAELEEYLDNKDLKQDERISKLDDFLTERLGLPEIKGDEVIQIGIVLYRNNKPEAKHIFVLDTCERDKVAPPTMREVPVSVYPFKTEAQMLNAFHDWLRKTDPDCMIGYNIFGFDEKYLWTRCEELKCIEGVGAWSRLTSGKPKLLEKFLSSAAMGDNTMYIINAPGRLKVDLLPYIRRNYNLDSYTLDNVSATFMSGNITGKVTELSPDVLKVPTKSTKSAVIGRFVVLLDDDNDKVIDKAEIIGMDEKSVHLRVENGLAKLADHGIAPSRWAQVKDDVSPKELFALQRGSAADRAKIARYCLQDCDLVMELFMKLDVLNNSIAMANVCSVPVSFIFMRGQGVKIESLIFKECRLEDQLIEVLPAPKKGFGNKEPPPPVLDEEGEEEKPAEEGYEGAFVLDPVTGIYFDDDPVGVPDFSSLYPSTIISENLCHSSLVHVKDYKPDGRIIVAQGSDDYDNIPGMSYIDVEYNILINDPNDKRKHPAKINDGLRVARFAQLNNGEKSTIPKILQKLLSQRKATRKKAEKEEDEFKKALLDAAQLAYKLTANSLYGQLGSGTSKIRHIVIAASTTAYGRKQLIYAKNVIESVYGKGNDPRCDAMCVYGDTDSIFVRWRPMDPSTGARLSGEEAVRIAKELTEESGALISSCLKPPHDFEFDKVFRTFCLLSKKRYVGDMSEGDLDDFHRKAMGIVMKRRDNAPIVKYVYGGAIEQILSKQDITAAFHFVQKASQDLVDGKFSMSKLTITKSLRAEYKTPTPPAHKQLAERMGQRDPGNKPSTTERIPYVYIPAPPNSTSQGDRIETPQYIKEHKITPDYAFYITNQIAKPVAQVFGLVVEKLPGVNKADIQRINSITNPSKRVDAREDLASELLFGAILSKIMKERKAVAAKKKIADESQARASFINMFNRASK